jgi:uncharacterized protein with HEPN domain
MKQKHRCDYSRARRSRRVKKVVGSEVDEVDEVSDNHEYHGHLLNVEYSSKAKMNQCRRCREVPHLKGRGYLNALRQSSGVIPKWQWLPPRKKLRRILENQVSQIMNRWLRIYAHGSSDGETAFNALREHVQALGENIEYVAAAAREVEEDRHERMERLELRWMSLTGMLDRIIHRAGVRINAEDAAAMDRLERLERQVERFGEKLEDVCEYLGMGFDAQDRVRRPPALYHDEYAPVRYLFRRGPRPTSRTTPAHPSDAEGSNSNVDGVDHAMPQAAADTESRQDVVNHSAATATSPQPTLPTVAADTTTTSTAENSAATTLPAATAATHLPAATAATQLPAATAATQLPAATAATQLPAATTDISIAANNVDPAAIAPPVCANDLLSEGATCDAADVMSADCAAKLVVEAHAALDVVLAAVAAERGSEVPSSPQVVQDSAPAVHPGITVVHPTPDNSQDTAATHTTLIPPGAINAAGMQTRSRSRSFTPAPRSPTSLPVPQPQAESSSSSKPKSTGSSRVGSKSPRPGKRRLEAEGGRGKRLRQG